MNTFPLQGLDGQQSGGVVHYPEQSLACYMFPPDNQAPPLLACQICPGCQQFVQELDRRLRLTEEHLTTERLLGESRETRAYSAECRAAEYEDLFREADSKSQYFERTLKEAECRAAKYEKLFREAESKSQHFERSFREAESNVVTLRQEKKYLEDLRKVTAGLMSRQAERKKKLEEKLCQMARITRNEQGGNDGAISWRNLDEATNRLQEYLEKKDKELDSVRQLNWDLINARYLSPPVDSRGSGSVASSETQVPQVQTVEVPNDSVPGPSNAVMPEPEAQVCKVEPLEVPNDSSPGPLNAVMAAPEAEMSQPEPAEVMEEVAPVPLDQTLSAGQPRAFWPYGKFGRLEHRHQPRNPGNDGMWACICGTKRANYYGLHLHVRRHTQPWFFKCVYCKQPFFHLGDMKGHLRKAHGNSDLYRGYNAGCAVCGKMFRTKGECNTHRINSQ